MKYATISALSYKNSPMKIRYKHLMVQLIEVLMIPIELRTERASLWFYTDVLFDQDS